MKTKIALLSIAVAAVAFTQPIGAISTTSNVTLAATVSATAKLTVSSATLSFPNSDPDTVLSIPASEGAVTITAKAKTTANGSVTLTLVAGTDLTSGTDTIAISNVSWTVSGTGFAAGAMNKTTAQSVASWTGSGARTGTQTFALANNWAYPTGSFSATATYTLTAP
ncbi:MAG: hypothetical protein WCP29_16440 [Acidobacteriota bacterium]